jgi:hypothetical protein
MCDIGIGLAKADDDLEQFANRTSGAAGGRWKPQRSQPGTANEVDGFEGKDTLSLAFARAFGNVIQ